MKVLIQNEEYEYLNHIVENERIRTDFMELINDTFGFDFRPWHAEGYWTEKYEPHVLVKGNQVVATVTVNHMKYRYKGEEKKYIQLGGVLTRKEYRKKDLGRCLMEHIISEYQDNCDQIFLLCNDSAVDYYPKFGFKKAIEYIANYKWEPQDMNVPRTPVRKLNMDTMEDRELLVSSYSESNPFSRFPSVECQELLLFYALGFRKDCMYYYPELGVVVSAKIRKSGIMIEDIYGTFHKEVDTSEMELLKIMLHEILMLNDKAEEEVQIQFGFTPIEALTELELCQLVEKDDTLYLLENKENIFEGDRLRFPILSHN